MASEPPDGAPDHTSSRDRLSMELWGRPYGQPPLDDHVLNLVFASHLASSKRGRGDQTTLEDHLWSDDPARLGPDGHDQIPDLAARARKRDLFIDVVATSGGSTWVPMPSGSVSVLDASILGLRFGLNLATYRTIAGPNRPALDRRQPFVTVGYRASGSSLPLLVGTLAVVGSTALADDLATDPWLSLVMRQQRWPMGHPYDGPAMVLVQGETVLEVPLDHPWIVSVGETPTRFNGKNTYFLVDMCVPSLVALSDKLHIADSGVSRPRSLDSFFGAQVAMGWVSTDTYLDIWSSLGENGGLASAVENHRKEALIQLRRMAGEQAPTSDEIISSVVEQIRATSDPLGRLVLIDALSKEIVPTLHDEGYAAAAEFVDGDGTWTAIGAELGITRQAAQQRFNPELRAANVERFRRRREDEGKA